jgi:DNA-binding NarL/FixJ family response regulator
MNRIRIRVLLADADESLLASYRDFLEGDDFAVATASTGLDCVEALRRCVPHVLVLDPELPWGRGEGVLALLFEAGDFAVVPEVVVLLSHDQNPPPLTWVTNYHVREYLIKPTAPGQLAMCIRQLLGRGRDGPPRAVLRRRASDDREVRTQDTREPTTRENRVAERSEDGS